MVARLCICTSGHSLDHQLGDIGRGRQQEVRDVEGAGQHLPEHDEDDDFKRIDRCAQPAQRQLRVEGTFGGVLFGQDSVKAAKPLSS